MNNNGVFWKTYYDRNAPEIFDFRLAIVLENGGVSDDLKLSQHEIYKKYEGNRDAAEEIFKYSSSKWNDLLIDEIVAAEVNTKIIAISCIGKWKSWIRVGMHMYTLKSARKDHRSLYWREGGFLEQHVRSAILSSADGVFMSVYQHNKHLKAFVTYMKTTSRTLSPGSKISISENPVRR